MRRSVLVLVLSAALVAAGGPASAATDWGSYTAHGEVLNILPPGSRGNVAVPQLLQLGITQLPTTVATPGNPTGPVTTATPTTPTNFADQLEKYDALGRTAPGQLTASALTNYYKDARLGVAPGDVVSTESPRPGVVIGRDRAGVPHITGATFQDVEFGAGYANIEDRMFLTDVLRHTGAARMAEFVGATPANIAMDEEQLRLAPYTVQQADDQIASVVQRYGDEGRRMLTGVDAMLAGMNAAQSALCPLSVPTPLPGVVGTGFGVNCPVEYAALQKPPQPYVRSDIVYIASLVGGIFGKGGGGEEANARWYEQLRQKYGAAQARRVFDDLREKNDPEAPTTSAVAKTYGGGGVDPTLPGVALPDLHPAATAPGSGSPIGGGGGGGTAVPSFGVVDGPLGPIDLGLKTHGMSNALLVDAQHSASGHPTVVFGPQTGYFTPQLLVEQDLRGPGIAARGVSFAGTNLVVELGHGVDYAWSATSASNDVVDTVVERLCTTDGSTPTVQATSYLVGSVCTPMESYVHTEHTTPGATDPTPPQTLNFLVLKTRHGVVQGRTTLGGAPVAVVSERTTYGHEADSVIGFARLQNPDYVHDAASFQRAVSAIDYTFNWFYSDDRDISYYSSGLLPARRAGYDWDLPRWGDAAYDDTGTLPPSAHPHVTDPGRDYLVSWNNKTAPGFSAADNQWGYGPVYRSLALEDRVKARIGNGKKVTRQGLVDAMMDGGTVDIRAAYDLPAVLDVIGTPTDAQDAAAARLLRAWVADGAHRVDRDRDGAYGDQAAIDLLDVWWDPAGAGVPGTFSLPKDVLRGGLGGLVDQLPQHVDDHPRQGLGSSFNGVAWYGYVSKDLRALLGQKVAGPYSRSYCGGGSLVRCRTDLRASLHAAVRAALAAQSRTSVAALTYDKSQDFIRSSTAGVVAVRPIDWQNRPTFQQVVGFDRHRPRPTSDGLPLAAAVALLPVLLRPRRRRLTALRPRPHR